MNFQNPGICGPLTRTLREESTESCLRCTHPQNVRHSANSKFPTLLAVPASSIPAQHRMEKVDANSRNISKSSQTCAPRRLRLPVPTYFRHPPMGKYQERNMSVPTRTAALSDQAATQSLTSPGNFHHNTANDECDPRVSLGWPFTRLVQLSLNDLTPVRVVLEGCSHKVWHDLLNDLGKYGEDLRCQLAIKPFNPP